MDPKLGVDQMSCEEKRIREARKSGLPDDTPWTALGEFHFDRVRQNLANKYELDPRVATWGQITAAIVAPTSNL